jgi:hypothetical protein
MRRQNPPPATAVASSSIITSGSNSRATPISVQAVSVPSALIAPVASPAIARKASTSVTKMFSRAVFDGPVPASFSASFTFAQPVLNSAAGIKRRAACGGRGLAREVERARAPGDFYTVMQVEMRQPGPSE